MNKLTISQSEMDSINFPLDNEGDCLLKIECSQVKEIFIPDCPDLYIVCGDLAQRSLESPNTIMAIVRLSLKVIDDHLFNPSITIICARLKRQRFYSFCTFHEKQHLIEHSYCLFHLTLTLTSTPRLSPLQTMLRFLMSTVPLTVSLFI
jgi:hypothetical protein